MDITSACAFNDKVHIGVIFKAADIIDQGTREESVFLQNAGRSMTEVVNADFLNIEVIRYHIAAGWGQQAAHDFQ